MLSDRYVLQDRLGSGGMGTVWRAHDRLLGRTVAVKEMHLRSGGAARADQAARAHRESHAIARISHPNVVNVYDLVTHDERLWLVMEFVDGPSLAERVAAAGPMSPAEVAGIGLQLLSALEAVHAAGALHRDVKPANVLLRRDGRVVLCDFGIAALTGADALTESGAVVGSYDYIAPERLGHRPVGPPSDLFSLGVTLCWLLSGRTPFARPEPAGVLHAIATEPPELPAAAGPLRPALEALLRKDPADRPPAAEASRLLRPLSTTAPTAPDRPATAPGPAPASDPPVAAPRSGPASHPSVAAPRAGSPFDVPVAAPRAGSARRRRRLALAAASAAVLLAAVVTGGVLMTRAGGGVAGGTSDGAGATASRSGDAGAGTASPSVPVTGGPVRVEAVLPVPGDPDLDAPGHYWMFSGDRYVRVSLAASGYPVRQLLLPSSPLLAWQDTFGELPGFRDGIDATLRVPGSRDEYWVFSGSEYIRIRIAGADQGYDDTLVAGPRPLSDWRDAFGDLADEGIDAVMRTPDDPDQYWVFAGDRYVRTTLDGEGPAGSVTIGPSGLDGWPGTFGKVPAFRQGIDAAMPVPGERNDYWVFSGARYMKIRVTDRAYEDTVLEGPRPLRDWAALD
ncbi:protein kinase domain-containing protein [Nonomuraea candida]|uniref:protein kinase domain-containing protein n=1 Tax=Nonomuraea candida TaxID=359159 RepID=UPI000694C940|nr:protein kinase [Nonomuraea candida]